MLIKRIRTGLLFGLLLLGAVWVGGWFFAGFLFLIAWYANLELHEMLVARGIQLSLSGMQIATALNFASWEWLTGSSWFSYSRIGLFHEASQLALFLSLLLLILPLLARRSGRASMAELGAAAFTVFYTGWMPAHWMGVLNWPTYGFKLMVLAAAGIIAVDTGAYSAGKLFGRRPFFQSISPKKTWEGAAGGMFVPMPIAAILAWAFGLDVLRCVLLVVPLSIAAQFGDLIESLIKRDAGVKDSGDSIPGHGGLLDRADSFILTGAITYYFGLLVGFGAS